MTDRIFPGSGTQSFLHANGIIQPTPTKRLEDVSATKAAIGSYISESVNEPVIEVVTEPVVETVESESLTDESLTETFIGAARRFKSRGSSTERFTKGSKVDVVGDVVKNKLTGASKPASQRTAVETFCVGHWTDVATSIIVTIVILAIAITLMVFLGFVRICSSTPKPIATPSMGGGMIF